MDVYTLDSLFRRIAIIDQYESFIWTERWYSYGDFQMVIHSTPEHRKLLSIGTKLAINGSNRIQYVETIENKKDSEGRLVLTISGRTLEAILEDRVAKNSLTNLTIEPRWSITETPGNIARIVFDSMCRTGDLSPRDKIPFLMPGTLTPSGTLSEPNSAITVKLEPTTVYEAIKKLCETYSLGFRLIRNGDSSELYFEVYSGDNRTSSQTSIAPVIFSSELDNLANVTELTSTSQYKNVAYVFSKKSIAIVYGDSADPVALRGFERRVLMVKVDDIDDAVVGQELIDLMHQKGKDALAEHRALAAFDGELPQTSIYRYGVDYNLGDLVEMRNSDGAANHMRVTEQIFVSDGEGVRSYPTLAIDLYITPGSWVSWDGNETWENAEGTWSEA